MSQATLRVQKISGHAGSVLGEDTQREYTVAKLIDTTTCIGCKACEVACMEWNDLPFHAGHLAGFAADAGGGVDEFRDGVFALSVFAKHAAGVPGDFLNA